MDGIAGSLAREVGHEKIDVRLAGGRVLIEALEKIYGTENVENMLLHGHISSYPFSELVGEGSERFAAGQNLVATAGLEKNRSGGQQCGGDSESPVGFHGRASSFFRPICKSRCRRKSIANETTKTSHPENAWKKPSALSGSQYCTNRPVPTMRRLLAATAMGIEARANATRTHMRVSARYP